jgi:nucleoside-triphosphatase
VGKTTAIRRLAALLRTREVTGFTTQEVRLGAGRVGFTLETLTGRRAVLAHIDFPGPPRVGRYGVDPSVMDRLAVPALVPTGPGVVVLVDELGQMELASPAFRNAVTTLLDSDADVIATVHARSHPFTNGLKQRADIEVMQVTPANRDALPELLAARLEKRPSGR